MKHLRTYFSYLALLVVGAVYAWSIAHRILARESGTPEGYEVLRISHCRLEPGYREALELIIRDFEEVQARRGHKVKVQQIPIASRFYEAWLITQLTGQSAPDICQQPLSREQRYAEYYEQFFFPLDEISAQPNPWHEFAEVLALCGDLDLHRNLPEPLRRQSPDLATSWTVREAIGQFSPAQRALLENSSHRETFVDGMLGGYNYSAARYYNFTTVASQLRILYNRRMVEEATGRPELPETLGAWLQACEALGKQQSPTGRPLIPISATKDTTDLVLYQIYYHAFRYPHFFPRQNPAFGIGTVTTLGEMYFGRWSLRDRELQAYFEFARAFSALCTPGYQSVEKDGAVFSFVQERAAMIPAQAEDVASLYSQCRFPLGVMRFPIPGPGESWSDVVYYPKREVNRSRGQFSLAKQSAHPELARDFMYFWTSAIWNERFNRYAQLVPVIRFTRPAERLVPFLPDETGITTFGPEFKTPSGSIWADYRGEEWKYLSGETDFKTFIDGVENKLSDPFYGIPREWAGNFLNIRYGGRAKEASCALESARRMVLELDDAEGERRRLYSVFRSANDYNGSAIRFDWDRLCRETGRQEPFPDQTRTP